MTIMPATNAIHRPPARALTFWALGLAVLTVATVPIIIGYAFGTVSITLAAVVIGRSMKRDWGFTTWGAWMAVIASAGAMVGYLVYMLSFATNYG